MGRGGGAEEPALRLCCVYRYTPAKSSATIAAPIRNAAENPDFCSSGILENSIEDLHRDPAASGLAAEREPLHQWLRQACLPHPLLYGRNIVGHAPELDDAVLQIGDGKCGARITVARLANGSGIEQVFLRGLQAQRGKAGAGMGAKIQDLEFRVAGRKTALQVRVSEKGHRRGRLEQPFERLPRRKDVFVLIVVGAVNQHYAVSLQRAPGKFLEEFEVLFAQLFARPVRCGARHGIEIIRAHQACGGFVVVAADDEDVERSDPFGDFVGVRAVADDVTQTAGAVPASLHGPESSVKSFGVRMNIAQNQQPHSRGSPKTATDYR